MSEMETFSGLLRRFKVDADALGAPFFYFSAANVLPKLALGKVRIEKVGEGHALVSPDGAARVIPTGDRRAYYDTIIAAATAYPLVVLIPPVIARHLSGTFKAHPQHKEFLFDTEAVIAHSGSGMKSTRRAINRASDDCTVEEFQAAQIADYLALNAAWYREAAGRHFRTYDKTSIDWLLSHWDEVRAIDPTIRCLGIRRKDDGVLQSFNIGSVLTDRLWTAYTRRFLRDGQRGAGPFGLQQLGVLFNATHSGCNDGTADTKEIRQWKERLGAPTIVAMRLDGRGRS